MKLSKIFNFLLIVIINIQIYSIDYRELTLEKYSKILGHLNDEKIYTNLEKKSENHAYITVIGIIDEAPKNVWKIINHSKQIYPDVLEDIIVFQKGNYYIKKKLLNFPFPFSDRWTVIEEYIYDELFSKEWKEKEGDIKINRGAIRLYPFNNKTLMIFKVSFDPGLKFVPEWVIEFGMKYKAPTLIDNIRKFIKDKKALP